MVFQTNETYEVLRFLMRKYRRSSSNVNILNDILIIFRKHTNFCNAKVRQLTVNGE